MAHKLSWLSAVFLAVFAAAVLLIPAGDAEAIDDTFTVTVDFEDNNPQPVTVELTCPSGAVVYNPSATLTAAETAVDTSIVYNSAGDPISIGEAIKVDSEKMTVTAVNTGTNTLTVVRGALGTMAAAHSAVAAITPALRVASEAAPAVFQVNGFSGDPFCTASLSPVPVGYESSVLCSAAIVSDGGCEIEITVPRFYVRKNFVPNNPAAVTVGLVCTDGTVTPVNNPPNTIANQATETFPAEYMISGHTTDPTCTATETPIPGGYVSTGTCQAVLSSAECVIANIATPATFEVRKNFIPNSGASVTVSVSCTSGSVSPPSASASEASPALFTVSSFSGNPICTATETIPPGYSSSGSCENLLSDVFCTITNVLNSDTFTVRKDFVPNNAASVTVSITCDSGSITPASASSSEASPAVFTVAGFTGDPYCTATEAPIPGGYQSTGTCGAPIGAPPFNPPNTGSCTIVNVQNATTFDTFTVNKDFVPNSAIGVDITLTCASGAVAPAAIKALEAHPAVFTVSGFAGNPTCTATESPIPQGYNSTATCDATLTVGACSVVNTQNSGNIRVNPATQVTPTLNTNFNVTLIQNSAVPTRGAQTDFTFNKDMFELISVTLGSAYSGGSLITQNTVANANTTGTLLGAAAFLISPAQVPAGDANFLSIVMRTRVCGRSNLTLANPSMQEANSFYADPPIPVVTDTDGSATSVTHLDFTLPLNGVDDWASVAGDSDCDGFPDTVTVGVRGRENFMSTDATDRCADTTTLNDETAPGVSPWPPDVNDNKQTNLSDVVAFGPTFNKNPPDAGYNARFNITASGGVNLSDIVAIGPFFNKRCD